MTSRLRIAIERLYAAFSAFPKPLRIDGCPCCRDYKVSDALHRKPLRELTPDELSGYASSVFLTVGSLEDFLYFLPRILEIVVSEADWWPSPEIVARAVRAAEPDKWTDEQRSALNEYLDARFGDLLSTSNAADKIDSWLCALGQLGADLQPYLDRLLQDPDRLKEVYECNSEQLVKGKLNDSFWHDAPDQGAQIIAWFTSATTKRAIMSTYNLLGEG